MHALNSALYFFSPSPILFYNFETMLNLQECFQYSTRNFFFPENFESKLLTGASLKYFTGDFLQTRAFPPTVVMQLCKIWKLTLLYCYHLVLRLHSSLTSCHNNVFLAKGFVSELSITLKYPTSLVFFYMRHFGLFFDFNDFGNLEDYGPVSYLVEHLSVWVFLKFPHD